MPQNVVNSKKFDLINFSEEPRIDISKMKPEQVVFSHEVLAGRFANFGNQFSCICECICNCICDCICDCICNIDWFTVSMKIPMRAAYDVIYEIDTNVDEKFGKASFKQSRMMIEMDPSLAKRFPEDKMQNLKEVGKAKSGAIKYLVVNTQEGRRR